MKKTLLPFLLVIFAIGSRAQSTQKPPLPRWNSAAFSATEKPERTKLDLRLYLRLKSGDINNTSMAIIVQGEQEALKAATQKWGGNFKFGYGRVASVDIPEKNLLAFAAEPAVEKIENTSARGMALMDTARIRNNIDSVHAGYAPLNMSLTGKNVIMGIVDQGIYWQHGDFKDPADSMSTRIRYIWDQAAASTSPPPGFTYGNEWDQIDINNGTCTHTPPDTSFGHGTCVAGIAAGNGLSLRNGPYEGMATGVAPESQIIAVNVDEGSANYLGHMVDAINYCFLKASAMGKPCVVNTSTGTYYGSHDGRDLATALIDSIITQGPGRVVVAAAGNAGNIAHHLAYSLVPDSAYTFFKYNASTREVYFDLWADTANFSNAYVTVGANDANGTDLGRLPYYHVVNDLQPAPGGGLVINSQLNSNGNYLGTVYIQATLDGDRYHVEFLVQFITNTSNLWRLQTRGAGKFDLWSHSALIGSADIVTSLSGNLIQFPAYRQPDTLKTIVSAWQCSDKVITVGNYSNRASYVDADGITRNLLLPPYNEVVGKRFFTSSIGPTRDGRLKPDIMATGSTTICTGDANFIAAASGTAANRLKVSITTRHIRNGGTSMASPIVAGAAALYLQKRPTATYNEIKQLFIWTAKRDEFTGPTANNEYGNGKLNAFRAMVYTNYVYGTNDTACTNYNPLATLDTGGCVAKVYGCTDTLADNYNPAANIESGTCTYTVGIAKIPGKSISIAVLPNPFSTTTAFVIKNTGLTFVKGSIKIMDNLGRVADELPVVNTRQTYIYNNQKLMPGIYYYQLVIDDKLVYSDKLVVQ